jgi:hypothetical protein
MKVYFQQAHPVAPLGQEQNEVSRVLFPAPSFPLMTRIFLLILEGFRLTSVSRGLLMSPSEGVPLSLMLVSITVSSLPSTKKNLPT